MPPKSSLASLLGTLTNAAPVDFDPEALDADQPGPSSYNGNDSGSSSGEDDDDEKNDEGDEEEEYMNPRAHYADVGPSDMRKKAAISESDKINDARYQGVKSSRAELYADDDGDEEEDEEDEDEDDPSDASNGDDGEEDEEEESDSDEDDDNDDDDDDDDTEGEESAPSRKKQLRFADDASDNASESDSQEDQAQASTSNSIAAQIAQSASQAKALKARRLEDAEKGRQVRKQIKTFERALETRIKAQSVLRDVNRLPDPTTYTEVMSSSSKAVEPAIVVLEQLLELSETLFSLRNRLNTLSSSSEDQDEDAAVAAPASRKRKRDFDVTVPEDDEEAERTWAEIASHDQIGATLHDVAAFSSASEPHRRAVLDKWSLKVTSAAAAAAAASNGNKFTQLRAVNQTPSAQIDSALAGDGLSRLVSRTRVLRSETEGATKLGRAPLSSNAEEVHDAEVFDDSDFYSALLKELIERRSGVIPSGEGATAAMMLSGLNGKKKKANVDTRASKGRKLRYEVNDKIVNFMPPIRDRIRWGEDQIDRLFRQLATSSMGVVRDADAADELEDEADENADEQVADEADLAGLRIFG